jgi:hypothetical protein
MDEINKQIDVQNKYMSMVRERQSQICDLKKFFDYKNKALYKDMILLNLNLFEEIFTRHEYRSRIENIYSLTLSIGKVLDLNNSIKTVNTINTVVNFSESL